MILNVRLVVLFAIILCSSLNAVTIINETGKPVRLRDFKLNDGSDSDISIELIGENNTFTQDGITFLNFCIKLYDSSDNQCWDISEAYDKEIVRIYFDENGELGYERKEGISEKPMPKKRKCCIVS